MKCHYAVLGLELNANQGEVKKAYRKLALKWHPDKNLDNPEEAAENFRLVQAAYDILSDPQEKAWYDRNRDEILHKKLFENYKDNSLNLFEYFTSSCYRGYSDDDQGFYAVYRDVFKTIDKEDDPFRSSDSDSDDEMPTFGESNSDFDHVVYEFYAAWDAYCTRMTFVWVDKYDKNEAPNRRVMRLIEKENKKERDKHRKKRNDLVRELVAFVRKRDPRVKAHRVKLEEQIAEKTQKAKEQRIANMQKKVEMAAEYEKANKKQLLAHDEKVAALENSMKDEFGFTSSENEKTGSEKEEDTNEEEYSDDLYCPACNKMFKTDKAKRNHEKSKKHKENINLLREEIKNDVVEDENPISTDDEYEEKQKKLSKKEKKKKRQQNKLLNNSMSAEPLRKEDFGDKNGIEETSKVFTETADIEPTQNLKSNKKRRRKPKGDMNTNGVEPEKNVPEKNDIDIVQNEAQIDIITTNEATENDYEIITTGSTAVADQTNIQSKGLSATDFSCQICNQKFPTRNSLFKHIKTTGHAVLLPGGQKPENNKKRKGRKKVK